MPSIVKRTSLLQPRGPLIARPESVANAGPAKLRGADVFEPEMVPRNCKLEPYTDVKVPSFKVEGEIVTYCSPDSTYAVTKRVFDAAETSILIGIYDFSAEYMKELVLNAVQRGVKVTLMLDIDSKDEQTLFDDLIDQGVKGVPAPSCASHKVHYFSSSHEKVIIIDGEICMVQSGNFSENSIPLNVIDGGDPKHFRTGNRDTGFVLRSKPLADFFTKILNADMKKELDAEEAEALAAKAPTTFLVEKAPTKLPPKLFKSKTFKLASALEVQPVLSPDNYMKVIPEKLKAARKSILIEQQYIRGSQPDIKALLTAIKHAMDQAPNLDVRIILGKVFAKKELPKEKINNDLLRKTYKLKLGKNIRYIDTNTFVHCHNKMILVDGESVLVSSQNWSDSAVSKNREAGVWLTHGGICDYFTQIFESDWSIAKTDPMGKGKPTVEPEALAKGGYVRVAPADYQEV